MPKQSSNVVLFPPRIEISPLSNKYDLVLIIRWGEFEQEVKISKETNFSWGMLINQINRVLLDGSESNPYIIK